MDNKLFSNRLLHVPLFQGFSRLDFLDIVAKIPFDFKTLRPNEYVVKQGEECLGLCVVLSGEVETECMSPDQVYTYGERLGAPWCLQIENLFGYHNRYTKSYRTLTETQVMFIAKQDVRRMLVDYPAFQINFYNALSTLAQTAVQHNWSKCPEELELRFLSWGLLGCVCRACWLNSLTWAWWCVRGEQYAFRSSKNCKWRLEAALKSKTYFDYHRL